MGVAKQTLQPMSEAPNDNREILAYHSIGKTLHQIKRDPLGDGWGMRWNVDYRQRDHDYLGWIPVPVIFNPKQGEQTPLSRRTKQTNNLPRSEGFTDYGGANMREQTAPSNELSQITTAKTKRELELEDATLDSDKATVLNLLMRDPDRGWGKISSGLTQDLQAGITSFDLRFSDGSGQRVTLSVSEMAINPTE